MNPTPIHVQVCVNVLLSVSACAFVCTNTVDHKKSAAFISRQCEDGFVATRPAEFQPPRRFDSERNSERIVKIGFRLTHVIVEK